MDNFFKRWSQKGDKISQIEGSLENFGTGLIVPVILVPLGQELPGERSPTKQRRLWTRTQFWSHCNQNNLCHS